MPLQTRVGLATGLAVVGDLVGSGAAREEAVVGETPNLAARLQALADPDAVVIGDSTRRLVGNLFEYQSLGEVELKGLPAPVPAFRVIGESRVGSRFEALRSGEKSVTDETCHNRKSKHPGSVAGQLRYTSGGERGVNTTTQTPGSSPEARSRHSSVCGSACCRWREETADFWRWSATRGAVCRAIRAALVAN
jgi:hypothetical protein